MEIGENNATADIPEDPQEDVKKISIRVCVFFDGTLNNRVNINQRLLGSSDQKLTQEERKARKELLKNASQDDVTTAAVTYKRHGAKKPDEDNSYEGFYTNVEKMERHLDTTPAGEYQHVLKVYIEGVGSLDKEGDRMLGYAFALHDSGIPAKVEAGVQKVLTQIHRTHKKKDIQIEKLTFDVFGFSRGAASARTFIHAALFGFKSTPSIEAQLTGMAYTTERIQVCFAGLYDTVSTYGLKVALGAANNVKDLKLNAIVHAKQVVHLTSADEHREYFSLTDISSAGFKGKEIFLPGVHSDIGGGYRDEATEELVIYRGGEFDLTEAEKDRQRLIDAGWYQPDEIVLEHIDFEGGGDVWVSVNRAGIRNHYSRIPLQLMVRYARDEKLTFRKNIDVDEAVPAELSSVQQAIDRYINTTHRSRVWDWHRNDLPWLRTLRHDYCHFSARAKTGHTPRFSCGSRFRKAYNG